MKTKYSQFLLFPQPFRSYPMSVMFSYCLIGSCPKVQFFVGVDGKAAHAGQVVYDLILAYSEKTPAK